MLNIGYDNIQRMTSQSATVASTADFLNNYAYNSDSQITQIKQQGQTGGNTVAAKLVNFAYDDTGRLTTVSRYANLAATQLVATSTYGYNAGSELTSLSQDRGSTNLNSYTWSYDHAGRISSDSSVDGTDSYTYDAASQLTAATHSYETNESYSFGATGNRTNTGYSTGTNNEMTSDGTYNYLYDANGNMAKKTTISTGDYATYTWDYRNRLTDVKAYNSSNVLQSHEHYVYDVFNRLIDRQVDPTGGGTYASTQAFIYDATDNIVLVYNGSGTLTDRMLNGLALNSTLADENGSGTVSWLLADNQGTIRDVVQYNSATNTTTIVDHLQYNGFGVITSQSNSAYQPLFAYNGQMWDGAAGLYYYHARWLDATTGRFISQDPKGFGAGDSNLYRYVGNNPTDQVDPTGTTLMDPGNTTKPTPAEIAGDPSKTPQEKAADAAYDNSIEALQKEMERAKKILEDERKGILELQKKLRDGAARMKDLSGNDLMKEQNLQDMRRESLKERQQLERDLLDAIYAWIVQIEMLRAAKDYTLAGPGGFVAPFPPSRRGRSWWSGTAGLNPGGPGDSGEVQDPSIFGGGTVFVPLKGGGYIMIQGGVVVDVVRNKQDYTAGMGFTIPLGK